MKKTGKSLVLILLVIAVGLGVMMYQPAGPNSFILKGGTILTLDPKRPTASAILVEDGIITSVGSLTDATARDPEAEIIDIDGTTLIPGLIEPHTHPIASALLGAAVDVSGFKFKDRQSIIETLRSAAGGFGLTPWVVAYGWDPLVVHDLEAPTLDELDAISPDKPMVILTQMLHEIFANSKALEAAGLEINNPEQVVEGFLRDQTGRLTGTVKEVKAIERLIQHIPSASDAITELLVRLQYKKYADAGYTTIGVAGAIGRHPDPVGLLERIGNDPTSPLRTFVYLLPNQNADIERSKNPDFKVKGVKYWMDGSPFTGGAAIDGTYENSDLVIKRLELPQNHTGSLNYTREEFQRLVQRDHQQGYQIAVHVQGERAVEEALLAIERAQKVAPKPDLHHRLEHNALITQEQLAWAKRLGVTVGFFVDHVYYYGDALPDLMGEQRMKRYMPLRTALEEGLAITLHGDHPATPIGPFRSFRTAVGRLSESGRTVSGPDQAISRLEALKALTINAAEQLGEADEIGSIKIGKRADLTLLSDNPLKIDRQNLTDITVVDVWKNGQPADRRFWSPRHLELVWTIIKEKLAGY